MKALLFDIRYHLIRWWNRQIRRQAIQDDFDWSEYHIHYLGELEDTKNKVTHRLKKGDYIFVNGSLKKKKKVLPLHPNHRLLYETLLQLKSESILEVGSGGGDHLWNMSLLSPKLKLYGVDLLKTQLELQKRRSPTLKAMIKQRDITLPYSKEIPSVDCVYSQAVIMHIHAGNGHLVALSNMFQAAMNQVVLMENWGKHQFMSDILMLHKHGMIPWNTVYFYFRRSPELGNVPHLMVVSRVKLDYEPLTDYQLLA